MMIDSVFALLFIGALAIRGDSRIVATICLLCLAVPLIGFTTSFPDNLICALILCVSAASLRKISLTFKWLLFSAGFIQFLSMLSNAYYDYFHAIHNEFLSAIAYSVYLLFAPIVVIINVLILMMIYPLLQ